MGFPGCVCLENRTIRANMEKNILERKIETT